MDQEELDKHIKEISNAAGWINGLFNGLAIGSTIVICLLIYRKCL